MVSRRLVVLACIAMILSIIATPPAFADAIIIMADQSSRTTILSPDDNTSNSAKLSVRSDDSSNKSWIKFDLGDLDVSRLKTATLTIALHNPKTGDNNFDVSYVNDDCLDNIDWDERTITWNNAPGNNTADLGGLDPDKTTLLVTLTFTDGVPGDSFTIDVLEALEADTDGIVQFVIHNSGRLLDFATHDHAEEAWRPFISVTEGVKAQAKKPYPAEGTTEVPNDVILTWTPGAYAPAVNGHNVYFSDSFDDVNDGVALVSPGQDANSYDPGRLEFGVTYFWRVDEVNAPPESTIFPGAVWSFSVELFSYPIENITATASSAQAGSAPANTINGSGLDVDDLHSDDIDTMWLTAPDGTSPAWIQYEFDRVYKLYELMVWNYNVQFEAVLGYGFKDVTIEYSENGTDWMVLADVEFAQGPSAAGYASNTTVDMGGVSARYVRLTANDNWGTLTQYGLSEVRFTYIPIHAREPMPASGQQGVNVSATLNWRAGREAASHEVYLSTDQAVVADGSALIDTVTERTYNPGGLDFGRTYYWKIVEINEAEAVTAWEGNIWSFSTQEYAVIEDFESYDDNADNRIFDAWVDGWVNETGSTVGYLEEPFAEQTNVHSGRQAMPLHYDNTSRDYSVADYAYNGDLSENSATTLLLYFRGDTANDANEPMWVQLTDQGNATDQVVYGSAPGEDIMHIAGTTWQAWSIPLESFNVDVTQVKTLSIGMGEKDGSPSNRTGIIYIDDVQRGKPIDDVLLQ